MEKLVVAISIIVILGQCSDDEGRQPFAGITETNTSGVIIGNIDNSDWGIDETWNEEEQNLFKDSGLSKINNDGQDPGEKDRILKEVDPCYIGGRRSGVCGSFNMISPSFPNPAASSTSLRFSFAKADVASFGFLIVDQDFKVIVEIDQFFNQLSIDTNYFTELSPGKVYRAYYITKTVHGDFLFKGHGDIKFK